VKKQTLLLVLFPLTFMISTENNAMHPHLRDEDITAALYCLFDSKPNQSTRTDIYNFLIESIKTINLEHIHGQILEFLMSINPSIKNSCEKAMLLQLLNILLTNDYQKDFTYQYYSIIEATINSDTETINHQYQDLTKTHIALNSLKTLVEQGYEQGKQYLYPFVISTIIKYMKHSNPLILQAILNLVTALDSEAQKHNYDRQKNTPFYLSSLKEEIENQIKLLSAGSKRIKPDSCGDNPPRQRKRHHQNTHDKQEKPPQKFLTTKRSFEKPPPQSHDETKKRHKKTSQEKLPPNHKRKTYDDYYGSCDLTQIFKSLKVN